MVPGSISGPLVWISLQVAEKLLGLDWGDVEFWAKRLSPSLFLDGLWALRQSLLGGVVMVGGQHAGP